ncbi:helix-turn-helix transcriptional regulator [Kitasatospora purpeofusca]|uniref:Helix-turn-helix domain-containing protein n=1 Tax=Kitasatospora purpeofusca TaxID=67352 RepID=A0ABZ1UE94_9ACTN|nr:helix-turn-helix transcriptional regulator [Kitasatospora purpeofusca]
MALSTLETLRLTIAAIRQRTGESQRELAAALDLTQDKVSRRQSGAQSWSLDEVDALARHWGMRPLDLLAGPTHAAQHLAWPPGTAAPAPPPDAVPVPTAFAAPTPVPVTTATPAPRPNPPRRETPRRRTEPYTPLTPIPDGWAHPTGYATAPETQTSAADQAPPTPATPAVPTTSVAPVAAPATAPVPVPTVAAVIPVGADYDRGPEGELVLHPPVPCEQCGRPVAYRIGGRPLHLGGWCAPTSGAASASGPVPAALATSAAPPAQATVQQPSPTAVLGTPTADVDQAAPVAAAPASASSAAPRSGPTARSREYAGTGRDLGYYLDMITSAVEQALEEHDGDTEAASAALEKKAIPNGMALFDATRVGAAYEHTVYPERLEFLSKKTRNGADEIWEGRHKWENGPLMQAVRRGEPAEVDVDVLDTNAAYCSALKTHLPIGSLVHRPDGGFDPKRSGIYLLPKRPTWEHPHLPDPIGNRHETGPVLLDGATVRLLIRCHKLDLIEAPHITEAWTSGSSEGLLEKFRRVLTQARENAINDGDAITERYVKAIYAKFASTIGESTYNRDIRRPDWMHTIRSQAFANLWYKAHRAHEGGLTIVRLRGTDELHVTGETDWRTVFTEGRLATQMKLKDQYTLPLSRKRSA